MFVYTLALSLLTAVLCGLAPARSATRMSVVPALKLAVGEHDTRPERQRMRHWLVVGQVGLVVRAPPLGRPLRSQPLERSPGRPRIRSGWRRAGAPAVRRRSDTIGGDRAPAGGTADTHRRASRRSDSGAGEDRSAGVQGPRRNADAHGNRPAGPAWPNGARQSRQPRVVSDAADSAAGRTGFQWRGRRRGAARRDRERDAGAAILEWRARSANGSTGPKSSASCGQQILDARRDQSGRTVYTAYQQRPEAEVDRVRAHVRRGRHREGAARRDRPARPDHVRRRAADDRRRRRGARAGAGRRGR